MPQGATPGLIQNQPFMPRPPEPQPQMILVAQPEMIPYNPGMPMQKDPTMMMMDPNQYQMQPMEQMYIPEA